jgi:rhodanese-related sulfurtransferase
MDSWTWLGFYTVIPGGDEVERKAGGGAVPVDLRPREAFEREHIEGAINVPAAEILADPTVCERAVRAAFPEAKAVTLYLEGNPGEALLYDVAGRLEGQRKIAVFIYPGGLADWKVLKKPLYSTE